MLVKPWIPRLPQDTSYPFIIFRYSPLTIFVQYFILSQIDIYLELIEKLEGNNEEIMKKKVLYKSHMTFLFIMWYCSPFSLDTKVTLVTTLLGVEEEGSEF